MEATAVVIEKPTNLLSFFSLVGQIKKEKRTGWVNNNIANVESVSDHMYRMAIMAMMLDSKNVDVNRCIKMCLVHDLAECIVGDITPYCGITKAEKDKKERDAMMKLTSLLPNKQVAEDMMQLWEEYNSQETMEARAVKDIDRFEMILQAYEYEQCDCFVNI